MTRPRELTISDDDMSLWQRPIPELVNLRGKNYFHENIGVAGEHVLDDVKGDALQIGAGLIRGTAEEVGLKIRRSADGKKATTISFNGKRLHVAGLDVPFTLPPGEDTLSLHVFLDHSVLEVYASDGLTYNGRACITRVLDSAPGDQGVALFARGGKAECKWVSSWQMKSIWTGKGK